MIYINNDLHQFQSHRLHDLKTGTSKLLHIPLQVATVSFTIVHCTVTLSATTD